VIEYILDIHNWTVQQYNGPGCASADIASMDLTDVLRELQLSSWDSKLEVKNLGRKLWDRWRIYEQAISRSEVQTERESEVAWNLTAMLQAAYSRALSDCPDTLVIPVSC